MQVPKPPAGSHPGDSAPPQGCPRQRESWQLPWAAMQRGCLEQPCSAISFACGALGLPLTTAIEAAVLLLLLPRGEQEARWAAGEGGLKVPGCASAPAAAGGDSSARLPHT